MKLLRNQNGRHGTAWMIKELNKGIRMERHIVEAARRKSGEDTMKSSKDKENETLSIAIGIIVAVFIVTIVICVSIVDAVTGGM